MIHDVCVPLSLSFPFQSACSLFGVHHSSCYTRKAGLGNALRCKDSDRRNSMRGDFEAF
jgi:hypothetical protein